MQNGRVSADTSINIHDVTMIEVSQRFWQDEDGADSWKRMTVRFTYKGGATLDVVCFANNVDLLISDIITEPRE
tara:strand:- start:2526 stop:2747 length:222 start_codon:yes stop_codon:yes gene_type:complete